MESYGCDQVMEHNIFLLNVANVMMNVRHRRATV